MRRRATIRIGELGLALLALLSLACSTSATQDKKGRQVAALQYGGEAAAVDPRCATDTEPDTCALKRLVGRAAAAGATLIVAPEYAIPQDSPATCPRLGARVESGPLVPFAEQARRLKVHLVIDLLTSRGGRRFNTQVAFGPDGTVVALHDKFELFDDERETLQPGDDLATFDTPFGRVGLLICADLYGDLRRQRALTQRVEVVAVSSYWTAPGAARWQQSFARNFGVVVIGANTTQGPGRGGGVFGPDGRVLAETRGVGPGFVSATLPRKQR
jgi:predicted amidohydrolase